MENAEIKSRILAKVAECMEKAHKSFKLTTFQTPSVHFDVEGTNGGFAKYQDWSIHFNLQIAKINLEDYLKQTVPHEIAHLIDYQKYKGWGHKKSWKMIMKYVFGLEPNRCHNYDISEVKKKKYDTYIYVCRCQEFQIKSNMHKKICQGRNLSCKKCMTRIIFKQYLGKT